LQRLRRPIERALNDARIRSDELSHVVLAGGATRMPMVRRLAGSLLGHLPMQQINPDEVVARGAAVAAALHQRDAALREVVLTDVTPYTLGIETLRYFGHGRFVDGQYLPIIERNTVVPVSRSKVVSTVADNQTKFLIKIYQGESRLVASNIKLGELTIDVPAGPAGKESADVRFTYDVSGLLEVIVTSLSTGEKRRTVIQESPGSMSEAEIAEKLASLAALKIAPREHAENRAILARAERLHEETLGEAREAIARGILAFEAVLQSQDTAAIDTHRREFVRMLDKIDNELRL
jgi:molecular chaperone HscC